jgi:predicted dienelactone hydrolase
MHITNRLSGKETPPLSLMVRQQEQIVMKYNEWRILCVLAISFLLCAGQAVAADSSYDPLAISARFTPEKLDLTVHDAERIRDIPIRVYLPLEKSPVPVVLFSHGLGGSREGSAYLGNHWAIRGYVAVFLQHPGSDTSVWKDKPVGRRMEAMQKAAGVQDFLLRVKDVPAVLDQLDRWNKTDGHVLAGRLDLMRVGMSGHSFGALTTQAISGQTIGWGKLSFTDPRITAAIAFSPSSPRRGGDPNQAFGNVKIPWMLMTGTKDLAPICRGIRKSVIRIITRPSSL